MIPPSEADVPTGADGRPPRPPRARAPRPSLPDDVAPALPRRVHGELRQHVRSKDLLDEVAVAMTMAARAVEDEDPGAAMPYLRWCKEVAPRSPSVREILGIALYHSGEFARALSELRAYRRLSGTHDQDHLIADCLRATGRTPNEVGEVVQGMLASKAPADRRLEAVLVWANAVADAGDLVAAEAALRRADRSVVSAAGPEARDRLTFVIGDLAERAGQRDRAVRAFEQLAGRGDGDPFGVEARLARLRQDV